MASRQKPTEQQQIIHFLKRIAVELGNINTTLKSLNVDPQKLVVEYIGASPNPKPPPPECQ